MDCVQPRAGHSLTHAQRVRPSSVTWLSPASASSLAKGGWTNLPSESPSLWDAMIGSSYALALVFEGKINIQVKCSNT